jgi:hypothetical protein
MQFNQRISDVGYDWNPMSDPSGPVQDAGVFSMDKNPMNTAKWVQQAARFTDFGLPPQESTVPEFQSNQSIVYTRTIYPWIEDNTHLQMQEGMLVFVASYSDAKCKIYCCAPIYKLNIMMRDQYIQHDIATTKSDFYNNLEANGEQEISKKLYFARRGLEQPSDTDYDKDENVYITKLGIQSRWQFDGVVVSKSESTGPFADIDHPESTDMVTSMGVVVCQRARVHNIWGDVRPGHKLYLILTRVMTRKGYAQYEYQPWFSKENKYPYSMFYKDLAKKECTVGVCYVGLCTEVKERDPPKDMINAALGRYNSTQDAYRAYGSLPCIQVQIRV